MGSFFTLILITICLVLIVFWTWYNGISPMPTSKKAKISLFKNLPVCREGTIFELGSGWGTLVFPLAKKYPTCKVIGLENSPLPYLFSKSRQRLNPLPNLELRFTNFFSLPLNEASLIVCYLYPGAMKKLKIKFEKELTKGTYVISHTFSIPGWQPLNVYEIHDLYHNKIYLYKI